MKFDPLQPQLPHPFEFILKIFVCGVHGSESDKFSGKRLQNTVDIIVNTLHLFRFCGGGEDDTPGDLSVFHAFQQIGNDPFPLPLETVKILEGVNNFFHDMIGKNVCVNINIFHSYQLSVVSLRFFAGA